MKLLRSLNPFKSQTNSSSSPLLSREEFRAIIWHECARCDRNDHRFSLVLIEVEKLNGGRSLNNLILSIIRRMRSTDVLGWFDESRIGVFLPETDGAGAAIFISDIGNGEVNYKLYTYPSSLPYEMKRDSRDSKDQDRSNRRSGPGNSGKDQATDLPHADSSFGSEIKTFINHRESTEPLTELLADRALPLWKRSIDIAGSAVGLAILSPIFAIVAAYIKIVSPGPVFFKQERVGYMGNPFTMWKFRTMKADADTQVHQEHLKNLISSDTAMTKLDSGKDTRYIPLAGLLRKTSIDELPQLVNVFKGEMSLIGPRPCIAYEAKDFCLWHNRRFHALPGMTGLWQVSGKNQTTFTEMMRLDIRYSQSSSLFSDIAILVKTFPVVMGETLRAAAGKFHKEPESASRSGVKISQTLSNFVRQMFL